MKQKLTIVALCVVLISVLCGCESNEDSIQNTYAEIKKTISITESLENDYFAQYYNLNNLTVAKNAAQDAINNSKEESYGEILKNLKNENEKLSDYIDKERKKIYNEQTSTDATYEFPFEVSESSLTQNWSFKPEVKQSSSYPTWIVTSEADTTDGTPIICFFIDDSSPEFSYAISQIQTKEIQVMNTDGQIKSALVNTELKCTVKDGYQDRNIPLNERPAYFVVCNGQIKLLLQSYEGDDYYVPYIQA